MKCLHICNDLMGSKVHENLYDYLSREGINQTIFYPSRKHTLSKIEQWENPLKTNLVSTPPIKGFHRVLFRSKVKYLLDIMEEKLELPSYDIMHATTLFSDGALALKIYKKYKVPYIVAVRGTDVNLFVRYRRDLWGLASETLLNAERVVFISESLKNNFLKTLFAKRILAELSDKPMVIPNGIDPYWLNNINAVKRVDSPTKILYIGKFNSNKNVLRLIEAFQHLRVKIPDLQINLVGEGGSQEAKIKKLAEDQTSGINYHGPVFDKSKLKSIFRENHIFAMVSRGETFGLVYLEALTQKLPILYTKNQGIDGTFDKLVGESVIPTSVKSIEIAINRMISNYKNYEVEELDFSPFAWTTIAQLYKKIYLQSIGTYPQ